MGYNLITNTPCRYVCIDAPEARLAVGDRVSPIGDVAHRILDDAIECPKIIITHGKHGCVTLERGGIVHTIPAFARKSSIRSGRGTRFYPSRRRW